MVDQVVTLEIPAKAEYVALGRLAIAGLLRENRFSADAVADMKLALTEACSNSIRHAYNGGPGAVGLDFAITDQGLVLTVTDRGAGFHEDDVDCLDCSAAGIKLGEGGMGISIIRAVVDEFDLQHPDAGGTILVLTKRCDA